MKRMNWAIVTMLGLLLVGGLALDVSAQQPASAPPAQTETKPAAPADSSPAPSTPPSGVQAPAPAQVPSSNVQIETRTERTERVVERPARFLGVDPTVAVVIGAILFIVLVVGLVAMSRRSEEVQHIHHV